MNNEDYTHIKTKDYTISGDEFDLRYDKETDLLYTFPKPNPDELASYYDSPSYISHTDSNKGLVDKLYQQVKKITLRNKVALIGKRQKTPGSLLDIGAGTGDFLSEAKKRNWNVKGIEPSLIARNNAQKKEIQLFSNYENLGNTKFDVITMWHVLEHVYDLDDQIKLLDIYLKQNGTLIIAVPNYNSYDAKYYKEFWAAYDVPRHLWHFSKKAISIIFQKYGFEVQNIKPMWFDSFYVSLLSEKYKKSSVSLIKGFSIGLYSNLKAIWETKEFSSQIYTLKRVKS